jgi:GNAT superfamily N-acetyltransferase
MSATAFSLHYEPVCSQRPEFGSAALVPWDSEIFGFAIADYKLGDPASIAAAESDFRAAVFSWARAESVRMMSCAAPAEHLLAMPALSRMGFGFIELGLRASLNNVQKRQMAPFPALLRRSVPADFAGVESIAATAFRAGRYSADPLVAPEAAAQRYIVWIEKALAAADPGDRVFVMGEAGDPTCFFHLRIAGAVADLRLAAVRSDLQGGALGYRLYNAVLRRLQEEGVGRIVARLSATNTAVLNLYASLGFSFSNPEIVLHWHCSSTAT